LIASNASIEAALEPVKLVESICEGDRHLRSRSAVQPLSLDQPGTSDRVPERASQVPGGLGVVVGAPPARGVSSSNRQPSKSDLVHDHVRPRQHQIGAVARVGVGVGARHVKCAGTTEAGETVGGSSGSNQLSFPGAQNFS
jgi:hypothetical protein